MNKNDFVSKIKEVPFAQQIVYNKLQNLNNLEKVRNRLKEPAAMEKLKSQIDESKAEKLKNKLENIHLTSDSLSIESSMGTLSLEIVEREEYKCIKFEGKGAPVGLLMWIQIIPVGEQTCQLRITLRADLNMFIRKMVEKKLTEGVEQLAEMLAHLPYDAE